MIIEAILKINPDAVVSVSGDKLETCTIEWLEGTAEISKADIQAKINETQYQRDRIYPSIQEQLDMQYWDKINGTTNWENLITTIKTNNPKE